MKQHYTHLKNVGLLFVLCFDYLTIMRRWFFFALILLHNLHNADFFCSLSFSSRLPLYYLQSILSFIINELKYVITVYGEGDEIIIHVWYLNSNTVLPGTIFGVYIIAKLLHLHSTPNQICSIWEIKLNLTTPGSGHKSRRKLSDCSLLGAMDHWFAQLNSFMYENHVPTLAITTRSRP